MISIPEQIVVRGLTQIAQDPQIIGRILEKLGSMPNIPTPTMGGRVFWDEIANVDGWRLQKNKVFDNCRILDPQNVRRAWGSEAAMSKAFEDLGQPS